MVEKKRKEKREEEEAVEGERKEGKEGKRKEEEEGGGGMPHRPSLNINKCHRARILGKPPHVVAPRE